MGDSNWAGGYIEDSGVGILGGYIGHIQGRITRDQITVHKWKSKNWIGAAVPRSSSRRRRRRREEKRELKYGVQSCRLRGEERYILG